jgi:hypothetical protein
MRDARHAALVARIDFVQAQEHVIWFKVFFIALFAIILILVAVLGDGSFRWSRETASILARLEASKSVPTVRVYEDKELTNLPAPVQRYFRAALTPGQSIVTVLDVEHRGTFNMSATKEKWIPFISNQRVIPHRAGFDWDAKIRIFPGLNVWVRDAYVGGEGILHATAMGLVSLSDLRGTPEVAQGEFMRFVAESAWCPTRMLPSQGAVWQAVDDKSARLTLADGDTSATLLITFGADHLIASAKADTRARTVSDKIEMTPWQGRFWDYTTIDGMRVPQHGEVEWLTPEGAKPYWRGRITSLRYPFT